MIPDWAKKYKEKGTALEKHGADGYYLYKVHSERIKGKPYPVLVHDELIGTISREGLVYASRKIVDIGSLKVVPAMNSSVSNMLKPYADVFLSSYLVLIQKSWYFANLTFDQMKILNNIGIDYRRGIPDVEAAF